MTFEQFQQQVIRGIKMKTGFLPDGWNKNISVKGYSEYTYSLNGLHICLSWDGRFPEEGEFWSYTATSENDIQYTGHGDTLSDAQSDWFNQMFNAEKSTYALLNSPSNLQD